MNSIFAYYKHIMVIIHYEVDYDMNKLILLNEIKKEKMRYSNYSLKLNGFKNEQEDNDKSYIDFKEKFNCIQDREEIINLNEINEKGIKYNKNEKNLNKIMRRIFLLKNNIPFINFINSIYNDDLSTSTKLEYIQIKKVVNKNEVILLKNSVYSVRILVEDVYKKIEYRIKFQAKDDENLAIIINRTDHTETKNIISLNQKKKEHNLNNSLKEYSSDRCIIMLNSNIEVPDVCEFKFNAEGENTDCKVTVIKGWKYDFKQLLENDMYLLFPMKVLDLKQRLISISNEFATKELVKDEIIRFFKVMNRYLRKIQEMNLITEKDINELNLIAIDLLNNFITEKNNIFVDIKRDIEATLKNIVV